MPDLLPALPGWILRARPDTAEDGAFVSGAALALLQLAEGQPAVPRALLRARLSLDAAAASLALTGRRDSAAQLRDEVHLLRPGDQPGPGGAVLRLWLRATERPLSTAPLTGLLPDALATLAADPPRAGGPVPRAAAMLEAALALCPREEPAALVLADATLSRALGWDHVLPLLAGSLTARDLRLSGPALQAACHRAVTASATAAVTRAGDLARRAGRLRAVAPRLRGKTSDAAVARFLSRDALSPSLALSDLMSDRAARRLCDRLVALGVVRELTGRATFRLYGV